MGEMCTLQTGTLCYNAINIIYVIVLICRIARELNLSFIMVLRKGICSLFIPLKLRSAVYVDTGLVNSYESRDIYPGMRSWLGQKSQPGVVGGGGGKATSHTFS